jgi:hypothetical protein
MSLDNFLIYSNLSASTASILYLNILISYWGFTRFPKFSLLHRCPYTTSPTHVSHLRALEIIVPCTLDASYLLVTLVVFSSCRSHFKCFLRAASCSKVAISFCSPPITLYSISLLLPSHNLSNMSASMLMAVSMRFVAI